MIMIYPVFMGARPSFHMVVYLMLGAFLLSLMFAGISYVQRNIASSLYMMAGNHPRIFCVSEGDIRKIVGRRILYVFDSVDVNKVPLDVDVRENGVFVIAHFVLLSSLFLAISIFLFSLQQCCHVYDDLLGMGSYGDSASLFVIIFIDS